MVAAAAQDRTIAGMCALGRRMSPSVFAECDVMRDVQRLAVHENFHRSAGIAGKTMFEFISFDDCDGVAVCDKNIL